MYLVKKLSLNWIWIFASLDFNIFYFFQITLLNLIFHEEKETLLLEDIKEKYVLMILPLIGCFVEGFHYGFINGIFVATILPVKVFQGLQIRFEKFIKVFMSSSCEKVGHCHDKREKFDWGMKWIENFFPHMMIKAVFFKF